MDGISPPQSAPGYRHYYTGALGGVGSYGYSWSSAISDTSGVFLTFYTQNLYPCDMSYRAHGFQLRCLSE